ncbi:MAG: M14 family zinc carboxypeptidase, partial [bacterium]
MNRSYLMYGLVAAASVSCAPATPTPEPAAGSALSCCAAEGRAISMRYRVAAIAQRRFTHADLWSVLDPIVRSPALRTTEIGRSIQGRPIRAITFGSGPTTVLLWSQMHGDESTATMALADLLTWMTARAPLHADLRDRIATSLTVVMVPMLNPDGAELFQRENAVGVDVNRDAAKLATPEARALKALRDSIRPQFGFNLHDQGGRILSGRSGKQVGIALLAPAANQSADYSGARSNARLVASGLVSIVEREIPGRVAKYEDAFNPRAFGDLMQSWGTSTVLIESGALPD